MLTQCSKNVNVGYGKEVVYTHRSQRGGPFIPCRVTGESSSVGQETERSKEKVSARAFAGVSERKEKARQGRMNSLQLACLKYRKALGYRGGL